jgi:hypothetical protein
MRSGEERRGVRSEEWGIPTVMLGQSEQAETMIDFDQKTGISLGYFGSCTDAKPVVARTDYPW